MNVYGFQAVVAALSIRVLFSRSNVNSTTKECSRVS